MGRYEEIMGDLTSRGSSRDVEGMARYGINTERALGGTPVPMLRRIARKEGRDHALAGKLWRSGIHEARLLATMIEEPGRTSAAQLTRWARQVDSWDLCDQLCNNLVRKSRHAWTLAPRWAKREEEFVRRAGLALMACLATHEQADGGGRFKRFLPAIETCAADDRNFVRKAVDWALRRIASRPGQAGASARELAYRLAASDSPSRRWVGKRAVKGMRRPKRPGRTPSCTS
jgi:3-methyladenine DNA glycosylase AlkD